MVDLVHTLLSEPRSPNAPRRLGRDWLLAGIMAASVIIEALVRSDFPHPIEAFLVMGVLITSVLWRRTNPLLSVVASFGTVILIDLALLATNNSADSAYSATWILILGYSLLRWGSGREIIAGLGIMVMTLIVGTTVSYTGVGDAVGGATFLLLPAAIGASIRAQRNVRAQQVEHIRLEERAQIARELHDTVAHHVSAIAISAQAGRVLAESNSLKGAVDALEVIEEEASRTLVEMRSMIGLLRRGGTDTLAPQQGIADLEQLAASGWENTLPVEFNLSGDLDAVSDPVSSAIYRLAQEAITNATRHARNASHVDVRVHGGPQVIRLTVSDDGDIAANGSRSPGFGLIGMTERVNLLGGSFHAGPGNRQGWIVQADLPRNRLSHE